MKIRFRERKSVARVKYFDYTDVAKPLFYYVGNIARDISGITRKSTAENPIGAADFLIFLCLQAQCLFIEKLSQ